jgi:hypothetical protein
MMVKSEGEEDENSFLLEANSDVEAIENAGRSSPTKISQAADIRMRSREMSSLSFAYTLPSGRFCP